MTAAYLRHPTVSGERIVFVAEDDLWMVGSGGGTAVRLTANPGHLSRPRLSPDGNRIAYISRDEGPGEVWVAGTDASDPQRLTHFGATTQVVGWSRNGEEIIAASDVHQPFTNFTHLWRIPVDGAPPVPMEIGPAWSVDFGPDGTVIGRNGYDPARWKRYRGGRAGALWIDRKGDGAFEPLADLTGNLADPMWVGRRVFFLSDHEGVGNLYSVTPTGRSLQRHTDHHDFYARFASSDGTSVVYQCGGDIWRYDVASGSTERIPIDVPSTRPERMRTITGPKKHLETIDLHPAGHSLALTVRGGSFTMPLWEGAPRRHGDVSSVRHRLTAWTADGERIISTSDASGEERLLIRSVDGTDPDKIIDKDLGRIRSIDVAPRGNARAVVTNHRHELVLVDLTRGTTRVVFRSPHSWIGGTAWSPDGRWVAFAAATTPSTMNLHLYDTSTRKLAMVGSARFRDHSPTFDPTGRYLYYLSQRIFDPVADGAFHDHGFPTTVVPMCLPLATGTPNPFGVAQRPARPIAGGGDNGDDPGPETTIDLDGLDQRALAFPVRNGRYTRVISTKGKVYLLAMPVVGGRRPSWVQGEEPTGSLSVWDFQSDSLEPVADGVTGVGVSADRSTLWLRFKHRIRVVPAGWKDDKSGKDGNTRATGWIDTERIRLEVRPGDEWRQMFSEAWRLQRDHYWTESMGGIDWMAVHDRYLPLVERISTRSEFSDLMWEMQGELGTSHAYEMGGSYRPQPATTQGHLGADLEWSRGAWRVARIPDGDSWDPAARSPLAVPGIDVRVGDRILAIDGVELDARRHPSEMLVDRATRPVSVRVARGRTKPRDVVVVPLAADTPMRYRDWVESNRRAVAEATDGRAGYIHIPDMQAAGFSEFHRSWQSVLDKDGLVVDVRFNRGGNVSQLLLARLLRRRIGYRVTRWRGRSPFPAESPAGPMVCLTNQYAGSDGDIFSHTFKLHGLGPLIGTRTWGGVIGIWPQQALVDGTVTTQPEFSTWFTDVGYAVENYGTDPDMTVVDLPQDYTAGVDRQLERAIAELRSIMESWDPEPDLGPVPSVIPPMLGPRDG